MEPNPTISIFDDLAAPIRRKDLIPKWINVFCWIFAFVGPLAAIVALVSLVLNLKAEVSIYGFSADYARTLPGVIAFVVFTLKGATAIGLLKEKDWAVKLAIIDGALAVVLCLYNMIVAPWVVKTAYATSFNFRAEILFVIPYLMKMINIRSQWEGKKPFEAINN